MFKNYSDEKLRKVNYLAIILKAESTLRNNLECNKSINSSIVLLCKPLTKANRNNFLILNLMKR